jgi:hypothetical protein
MKRTNDKQYLPLDEEEKELVRSIEKDEWVESREAAKQKKLAKEYAEATIRKDSEQLTMLDQLLSKILLSGLTWRWDGPLGAARQLSLSVSVLESCK